MTGHLAIEVTNQNRSCLQRFPFEHCFDELRESKKYINWITIALELDNSVLYVVQFLNSQL